MAVPDPQGYSDVMLTRGLVSECPRPTPPTDTDCIYKMTEPGLSQKYLAVSLQVPFTLFRVILYIFAFI